MTETAFNDEQYDLAYSAGMERQWWHLARNRVIVAAVRRFLPAEPTIIDVGCGSGIAVKAMRDAGIDCHGVEIGTAHALAGAAEFIRYGTDAVDLPAAERARCNAISLLDVIEHLPEPEAFVAKLAAAFPNLTHLVVTVPACPELWTNYDSYYGHYRRYTAASLAEFAAKAGLKTLYQSYFFHSLYIPARLITLLKRDRAIEMKAPGGWRIAANRLFARVMGLDYRLIPGRVPGMSLIACFKLRR